MAAAEQSAPFQTRVQEVASEQPGVRVFVVESEERLAYERGEREKAMGRVQPQLEALRRRVERAFRQLKDVIEMRPIYHQTDRRVQAHLFVAALAFLVDRALEKKLKSAGLDLSSREAWQILRTVRVVEIDLGGGKCQRSVTRGSGRAAQILKALNITDG